jgi:hypothetical protein
MESERKHPLAEPDCSRCTGSGDYWYVDSAGTLHMETCDCVLIHLYPKD